MKKTIALVIAFMLAAVFIFAEQYENPMLNMTVPSGLEDGQAYIVINHMFLSTLHDYPTDDFYAVFDGGANFGLGFRYMIGWGIEAKAGYTTKNREQSAGLSYTFKAPKLFFNAQADVSFFSYRDFVHSNYDQNLFYLLSLQSVPLLDDIFVLSVDAGYDGYNQNFGMSVGLSAEVLKHLRVIAEYYPVFKGPDASPLIGNTGYFSFGLKYDTFGHQFILRAGNSSDIGTRVLMLGTNKQDIYVGLTIMRLIAF